MESVDEHYLNPKKKRAVERGPSFIYKTPGIAISPGIDIDLGSSYHIAIVLNVETLLRPPKHYIVEISSRALRLIRHQVHHIRIARAEIYLAIEIAALLCFLEETGKSLREFSQFAEKE